MPVGHAETREPTEVGRTLEQELLLDLIEECYRHSCGPHRSLKKAGDCLRIMLTLCVFFAKLTVLSACALYAWKGMVTARSGVPGSARGGRVSHSSKAVGFFKRLWCEDAKHNRRSERRRPLGRELNE